MPIQSPQLSLLYKQAIDHHDIIPSSIATACIGQDAGRTHAAAILLPSYLASPGDLLNPEAEHLVDRVVGILQGPEDHQVALAAALEAGLVAEALWHRIQQAYSCGRACLADREVLALEYQNTLCMLAQEVAPALEVAMSVVAANIGLAWSAAAVPAVEAACPGRPGHTLKGDHLACPCGEADEAEVLKPTHQRVLVASTWVVPAAPMIAVLVPARSWAAAHCGTAWAAVADAERVVHAAAAAVVVAVAAAALAMNPVHLEATLST